LLTEVCDDIAPAEWTLKSVDAFKDRMKIVLEVLAEGVFEPFTGGVVHG
jgi:hypothetical protein